MPEKDYVVISIRLRRDQAYLLERGQQPVVKEGDLFDPGTLKLTFPGDCDLAVW